MASDLEAVVFDLGETLVSEERVWAGWADWLGVSRLTLFAGLGIVIERREPHTKVFELLRPGLDVERARREKEAAGNRWGFTPDDCYPDAIACLARLRQAGLRVGIAANQPIGAESSIAGLGLEADFVGTSATWGVAKPAAEFFAASRPPPGAPPPRSPTSATAWTTTCFRPPLPGCEPSSSGAGRGRLHTLPGRRPRSADHCIDSLDELGDALGLS